MVRMAAAVATETMATAVMETDTAAVAVMEVADKMGTVVDAAAGFTEVAAEDGAAVATLGLCGRAATLEVQVEDIGDPTG